MLLTIKRGDMKVVLEGWKGSKNWCFMGRRDWQWWLGGAQPAKSDFGVKSAFFDAICKKFITFEIVDITIYSVHNGSNRIKVRLFRKCKSKICFQNPRFVSQSRKLFRYVVNDWVSILDSNMLKFVSFEICLNYDYFRTSLRDFERL